jgi:alpha-soluble NSF attachment protein
MQKDISQLVDSAIAAKVALKAATDAEEEVAQLLSDGHLSVAASKLQQLAECAEQPSVVIKYYEQAARLYHAEGSMSRHLQCRTQIANLEAESGHYDNAIEIFEEIGALCDGSELLKWGSKKYYFLAVACRLATGDVKGAEAALVKYGGMFKTSREFTLCQSLARCDGATEFDRLISGYEVAFPIEALCKRLLIRFRSFCYDPKCN